MSKIILELWAGIYYSLASNGARTSTLENCMCSTEMQRVFKSKQFLLKLTDEEGNDVCVCVHCALDSPVGCIRMLVARFATERALFHFLSHFSFSFTYLFLLSILCVCAEFCSYSIVICYLFTYFYFLQCGISFLKRSNNGL